MNLLRQNIKSIQGTSSKQVKNIIKTQPRINSKYLERKESSNLDLSKNQHTILRTKIYQQMAYSTFLHMRFLSQAVCQSYTNHHRILHLSVFRKLFGCVAVIAFSHQYTVKTAAIATSNDFNKSSLLFQGQHMDAGSDNILDSMRGEGKLSSTCKVRGLLFKGQQGGHENNKHFLPWRGKA